MQDAISEINEFILGESTLLNCLLVATKECWEQCKNNIVRASWQNYHTINMMWLKYQLLSELLVFDLFNKCPIHGHENSVRLMWEPFVRRLLFNKCQLQLVANVPAP